ncbi:tripartite tricarboxylate transporter permease [Candidatus Nanosalina sp. VS9-1]|uniref:tripartite tricarboxylate transporter permease n=1 Tax=Candidatus Nanosalina sp. VS9-1 TaxID=3388566 RepID=UPI0039E0C856
MTEPVTLLLFSALGIAAGVATGLIPGIHPNTVIFTTVPFYLGSGTGLGAYAVFLSAISVSHTFHDFLPAIFLSSPDAESALSTINGKSAVQQGKGLESFHYTVYGALSAVVPVLAVALLSFFFLEGLYSSIESFMEYILVFFLLFVVLDSDDRPEAFLIALFSGVLGVLSFEVPVNQNFIFIPLFSGLFAVPAIIRSMEESFEIPDQDRPEIDKINAFSGGIFGTAAGFLAGVVPGIGAAVSTAFVSPFMNDSSGKFMSSMGAVNTTDIIFSIFTLQILGNARSGVSVALQLFSTQVNIDLVILVTLISVPVSALLALKISGLYTDLLENISLSKIFPTILVILVAISAAVTGFTGLVVIFTASMIGYAALETGNRRVCMAVLLVPSILFFSGIGVFI